MLRNLKKRKKGFTLIELIIVIAIIAIIAAIAIPKLLQSKADANTKADIANAKTIANAYINAVADDKIVPTSIGAGGKTVSLADSDADVAELKLKLQGVPTTNTPSKQQFYIVLDNLGGIQVWNANADSTAIGTVKLFPQN